MANFLKHKKVAFSKCNLFKRRHNKKIQKRRKKGLFGEATEKMNDIQDLDENSILLNEELVNQSNNNLGKFSNKRFDSLNQNQSISIDETLMQEFLEVARNGNIIRMSDILEETKNSSKKFDINYRGKIAIVKSHII